MTIPGAFGLFFDTPALGMSESACYEVTVRGPLATVHGTTAVPLAQRCPVYRLAAGASTITYTVQGVSTTYDVTIEESRIPATGQDFTWVWVLIGAALILCAAGIIAWKRTTAARGSNIIRRSRAVRKYPDRPF